MSAVPHGPAWGRFCAELRALRDTYGFTVAMTYQPTEAGRASVVLVYTSRVIEQGWKVIERLRSRGWVVRLVPGRAPSISVDLSNPAPEPEVAGG